MEKVTVKNTGDNAPKTLKARFEKFDKERITFKDRVKKLADLTLPYLLAEGKNFPKKTPYQSIGAKGVNTLASKLLIALLPPNLPFFKLAFDNKELVAELKRQGRYNDVLNILSEYEQEAMRWVEIAGLRVPVFLALKRLIVTGNACIFFKEDGTIKTYSLLNFIVKRDIDGNVVEIILKDSISPETLPEDIKSQIKDVETKDNVTVYTCFKLQDGKWDVWQEVEDITLKEKQTIDYDNLPVIVPRWMPIENFDYGVGLIEEYVGDIGTDDELSGSLTKVAAACAKVILLLNPAGTTEATDLAEADNFDIVSGVAEDISLLTLLDKYRDFSVAAERVALIEKRLEEAFLMNSAVRRDAERVTAEEVRTIAQELDETFGGVYSTLAVELLKPLTNLILQHLIRRGVLPKKLLNEIITPVITTGFDAFGRDYEIARIDAVVTRAGAIGATNQIDSRKVLERYCNSYNLSPDEVLKSKEQIEQETQQALQMQLAMQAANSGVVKEMVKGGLEQSAKEKEGTE